jgi:hypothetical protein
VLVLIRRPVLDEIVAGTVTLAFRRWRRPTVRAGSTLRTAVGVLAIDAVDQVTRVTAAEARAAGYDSVASLMSFVDSRPDGALYRIRLRYVGEDPRVGLRSDVDVSGVSLPDKAIALLRLIGDNPGVRAADLAEQVGRPKPAFKADVRKLKEKGLTESLEVGYRLSPRGEAYLKRLSSGP